MREWRCSCGETAPETGDGEGLRMIRAHQLGQKGHRIEGLYDGSGPDAEILIVGAKRRAAEDAGYITGAPEPSNTSGSSASGGGGRKSKTDTGNVELGVPFARLRMKPAFWGWVSLIKPMTNRDDGTPYGDDNDGIAEWVYDVVEFFGRLTLSLAYRIEMNSMTINQIAARIRGTHALNVTPEFLTPEAAYTNVEEVIEDAFAELERNARGLATKLTEEEDDDATW